MTFQRSELACFRKAAFLWPKICNTLNRITKTPQLLEGILFFYLMVDLGGSKILERKMNEDERLERSTTEILEN